ncbi:allophanate hydrolase [Paenibacillus humicola]|uniref:allophanate hydrolase n=1 Tax=Paenibacillus humicola TaxID=3110540 RepID=UPI00237B0983|nr:allophanate hydrolase [Paenibacillus humicola]
MEKLTIPCKLSIDWLRENYLNKRLTPEDVAEEIVRRSERDAAMNIWITPPSAAGMRPYLERLKAIDPADAPLWGIPFAVKDNTDVVGMATTAACPAFTRMPAEDAAVVKRLLDAGAIPVGKANLDQFATGLVGTRSPYGETHNALRPELISGGSSSGSAVAVARGQAAFALGTDTAGSGRVPAALNGLVGFKPSLGAWPLRGVVPACESLDCVTVFAHSMKEAYAVDAAARGTDERDPWSRKVPSPQAGLPLKICLPKETPSFFGPFAQEYASAWAAVVRRIEGLNLPVEYVDTEPLSEAAAVLYEGPWVAERWAGLGEFIETHPGEALPVTEGILRSGAERSASELFRAMHKLQATRLRTAALLKDAVLVLPTAGGTWTREEVRRDPVATNRDMGRYTNHCNLLGMCAAAIPAGEAAPALPFGVTLFALADREGLLAGTASLLGEPNAEYLAAPAASGSSKIKTTPVAVCGLHMRGFPLEKQMLGCGARFVREDVTTAKYKLLKLPTEPAKPGLIKSEAGGGAIRLEIWEMPLDRFGEFAASIPGPLGIGKVELADGSEVPGFICEGYAEDLSENITAFGGWRDAVRA